MHACVHVCGHVCADLVSKEAALKVTIGGKTIHVGGMCKGSGMIHPNMATMLAVVTCDAAVSTDVWTGIIKRASDNSFNAVRPGSMQVCRQHACTGWGGGMS